MPGNAGEAERKVTAAQARRNLRVWVPDDSHSKGGYWFADTIPEEQHGSRNTYNNWYCRCPACGKANNEKSRNYYKERRESDQSTDAAD